MGMAALRHKSRPISSESDSTAITVVGSLNPSVGTATATWQAETMGDRFTGWRVTMAAILIDCASIALTWLICR
jgi:hypothetical protein